MGETLIYGTGIGAVVGALGFGAYKVARPFFKIQVNCWFCNLDFQVEYNKRNAWTCPECKQYNGFNEDGDYNWDDPKRFQEKISASPSKESSNTANETVKSRFCQTCTLNQELKIHQLSKFVPKNEDNFDQEAEEFEAHLDKTYRLCRTCEASLHQVIGEQDAGLKANLLSWKLEKNRQTAKQIYDSLVKLQKKSGPLPKMFMVIMSLVVVLHCYHQDNYSNLFYNDKNILNQVSKQLQSSSGLLELVCSTLLILFMSHSKSQHNIMIFISWIFLALLCLIYKISPSFMPPFHSSLIFYDALFIFAASLINLVLHFKPNSNVVDTNQLKIRPQNVFGGDHHENTQLVDDTLTQDMVSTITDNKTQDSVSGSIQGSTKDSLFGDGNNMKKAISTLDSETVSRGVVQQGNPFAGKRSKTAPCDISSLSIDSEEEEEILTNGIKSSRSPDPFGLKSYTNFNASGINFGVRRRGILRPSKLNDNRNVVNSSWVAGGYWQDGGNTSKMTNFPEAISRSSSQSSGFVSQQDMGLFNGRQLPPHQHSQSALINCGLNSLPNSRANSTHGDLTSQQSIFSEPIVSQLNSTIINDSFLSVNNLKKPHSENLFNKSISQESFIQRNPIAKSSPILQPEVTNKNNTTNSSKFLDKKINITISLSSLLISVSVFCNFAVIAYLVWYFL